MGFEDESEILLLIPNVDATVGTSGIANAILIKGSSIEFSLSVFLSKSTVFEKLFACIGGVPELNRSCCFSNEFKIIGFLGPLDVENGIGTS